MKSNTEKFGKTPHQPSLWTRADALKVRADDPTTTQPLVSANFPVLSDEVFIWDTMPLRDIDGNITSVDGWSVIFTLTADRHPNDPQYLDQNGNYDITRDWNDRHGRAKMYYWFSRTGKNWELGGRVMAEGVSPTVREWAGTPILLNEQGEV
ncbi:glycoside hydrolase family 68 protein, partial [Pseudomonas sp. KHB2.9]